MACSAQKSINILELIFAVLSPAGPNGSVSDHVDWLVASDPAIQQLCNLAGGLRYGSARIIVDGVVSFWDETGTFTQQADSGDYSGDIVIKHNIGTESVSTLYLIWNAS